ncbi:MAG TPA: hypothetical protein VK988_10190 [Acidimicrobiales bacterium]|nr:hypothetical protein [Acidimicrobiales bacterium]
MDDVRPAASAQVVAAIVAAVDAVWLGPSITPRVETLAASRSSWRFSGRRWSRRRQPRGTGTSSPRPW